MLSYIIPRKIKICNLATEASPTLQIFSFIQSVLVISITDTGLSNHRYLNAAFKAHN